MPLTEPRNNKHVLSQSQTNRVVSEAQCAFTKMSANSEKTLETKKRVLTTDTYESLWCRRCWRICREEVVGAFASSSQDRVRDAVANETFAALIDNWSIQSKVKLTKTANSGSGMAKPLVIVSPPEQS